MSKRIEDGLFLGIDLGTSSVKLLVTDAKDNVIAESSASYPIYGEENGFFEQKPEDWINAIIKAAAELKVRERIYAIGLSAQMPTLVIMDADGKCLGNSIVWCDNRAAEEGRELLNLWGAKRHYETTGVFLDGRYLLPMYLWKKKREAELLACEHYILSAKDYLYYWLCGKIATDPSTASGYGVYDLEKERWSEELIHEAGLQPKLFPDIRDSFDGKETLTESAALSLRIPQNAAVVGGGADSVAGVLGMGGSEDGTVCMICGTSTAILGIRQNIRLNAENGFFVTPLLKAHTVGMEADILSSGNTQKWLLERIQEIRGTAVTHKELSQMASQAPAGADGLYFMPYLAGGEQSVLWDEELKGSLIGLNLSHRVSHIVRACYEGICFEALRCIKAFAKDGYEVKQVIVTGPVSSDSVFMQILADILGVSCKVSRVNNASAMGAALLARIGVMGEARCEENSEIFSELYSPDKQRHKRYEAIYSDYKNASANAKLQKLI